MVTKRAREISAPKSPIKKKQRKNTNSDTSDSEEESLNLIKVIQQTHKENIKNKDAKAVANMVETYLVENPGLIAKFRKEVCRLIVTFDDEKDNIE